MSLNPILGAYRFFYPSRRSSLKRGRTRFTPLEPLEVRTLLAASIVELNRTTEGTLGGVMSDEIARDHDHGEDHDHDCAGDDQLVLSAGGAVADYRVDIPPVALTGTENLKITSLKLVDGYNREITAPVLGQMVFIRATWTTDNLSPNESYIVRFNVDGIPLDSGTVTGQAGVGLGYYWWRGGWYATPGQHTFSATIDGAQVIPETSESDNTLSSSFTTGSPTTLPAKFTSPIGFDPNTDWVVGNYVDVDPREGIRADYRGGGYQYDQHNGWDIGIANFAAMDEGVPIIAAADGVVSYVEDGYYDRNTVWQGQPWNAVTVDHGQGWQTIYGHLANFTITVAPGTAVQRGDILGFTGSSGNSSGPHIHFMVLHDGALVETAYDTVNYWNTTRAYSPEIPIMILDSGISKSAPWADSGERAQETSVFSRTTEPSAEMWFWYNLPNVPAGTDYEIRWVRPNGTTAASITRTQGTAGGWFWGWYVTGYWTQAAGEWQIELWAEGQEILSRSVQVIDGAPPAELQVRDAGAIVVDDRTTPYDLAAPMAFTLQNYGGSPLNISEIRLPDGFSIIGATPTSIAVGASATLTVGLTASTPGAFLGDVVIVSNDVTNSNYSFRVRGSVSGTPAAGTPSVDMPGPAALDWPDNDPTLVDASALVTDSDAPANAANYQLAVDVVSGLYPGDQLSLLNSLTGTVSGNTIVRNNQVIANLTYLSATSFLAQFTSAASVSDVQGVLRAAALTSAVGTNAGGQRIIRARVTDQAGNASPSQYATVIVANDPSAPLIANQSFSIPENSANQTVVGTIVATDRDLGQTLTYAITGGNPGNAFAVNPSTGQITVANSSALNFETNNTFAFTVEVTDSSARALARTAVITIQVTDVNEAPGLAFQNVTSSLVESTSTASRIKLADIIISDDALGNNILSVNGSDSSNFEILGSTLYLKAGTALNFDQKPSYAVQVDVNDSGIAGSPDATIPFVLSITRSNRSPTLSGQTVSLAENSAVSTLVAIAAGSDPDTQQTLSYSITNGNTNNAFAINSANGQITVANPVALNFESQPLFNLTVRVTDSGTPALSATAGFQINLTNMNDAPQVANGSAQIAENSANGTAVVNVSNLITDQDSGQTQSYTITGGNTNNAFAISASTGQITVNNASALNFEVNPTFSLTIQATDNGNPQRSGTGTLTVTLLNVNEAPVISNLTDFRVNENTPNGAFIYQYAAVDPDAGQTKTFSIVSGNTGNAFQIGAQSGEFRVNNAAALDFETNPQFDLMIRVTDNGNPALFNTYPVRGFLNNLNDAPVITNLPANQSLSDQQTVNPLALITVNDPENQNMLAKATILNGVVRGDFVPASVVGWTRTVSGNNIVYNRFFSPQPNIGSVVQTALRNFIFQPRVNAIKPNTTELTDISVFVNDGVANTTSTTRLTTTSVNDAPSIGGASNTVTVNDNATVNPLATLTVADTDTQEMLISVTVLNGVNRGDFTNATSANGWTVRQVLGNNITYKRYFSPQANVGAAAQAAFRELTFQPRQNAIKPGTTEATDFQVTVSDGVAPALANNGTRVTTTSVNNTPTIGGAVANQTMNDGETRAVFSSVTVTDPDTQDQFVRITISNGINRGDFTAASTAGWTRKLSGANILYERFFAAAANNGAITQAAVRALIFQPRVNVPIGNSETTSFTVFINDGFANTTNSTTSVITTGVAPRSPAVVSTISSILDVDVTTIVILSAKRPTPNPLARLLKKTGK